LYRSLAASLISHSLPEASVRFTITNLGLNPVYTKVPSVEPLPV
jgi:hypothetical protein